MVEAVYDLRIQYPNENCNALVIDKAEGLKSEDIIKVQAEMLSANSLLGHVPLLLEEFNLNIKLYYDIRDYKSLNNYLMTKQYSWPILREIFIKIIGIMRNSSKYLLDSNKYILKLPLIYIHPEKNKPQLIYLPLRELKNEAAAVDEFKQLFINVFKDSSGVELNFYNIIIDYFDNDEFTIDGLYKRLLRENLGEEIELEERLERYETNEQIVKTIKSQQNNMFNWPPTRFFKRKNESSANTVKQNKIDEINRSKNAEEKLAETTILKDNKPLFYLEKKHNKSTNRIDLNMPNFIIGRNKDIVNYCEDSKEISRVHLEIIRDTHGYLIRDLDSKNGSFLNGIRLYANKLYLIKEGDKITLAKTEFSVKSLLSLEGDDKSIRKIL